MGRSDQGITQAAPSIASPSSLTASAIGAGTNGAVDVEVRGWSALAMLLSVIGLRRPNVTFVLCAAATLIVLSDALFFAGLRSAAISANLLACGALLVALVQVGLRRARRSIRRPQALRALLTTGAAELPNGTTQPAQSSDRMAADV